MADWKQRVDISDLHLDFEEGRREIVGVAWQVATRLMTLSYYKTDPTFHELVDEMSGAGTHSSMDEEDYDSLLSDLYDWGDVDHRLWINTIPGMQDGS